MTADRPVKICFVYKEDYPWDVRVEKIVKTLAAAGHEVTLLCRNRKRLPVRERSDDFAVRRMPASGPAPLQRVANLLSTPFYFSPIWFLFMWSQVRDAGCDVLIVRDLPLMPIGIVVARLLGRSIVFDMAECYPEMYASSLEFAANKWSRRILKNPGLARLCERFAFRYADHVLVMIEESRDRLLRLGADPQKVTIVSNTPPLDRYQVPPDREDDGVLRLAYVGFVTRIRGIDVVLRGLKRHREMHGDVHRVEFDVVGIGAALAEYESMADEFGLADRVRFHGWCEQDFVDDLYGRADVGVLTYHVCSHWNHTIPNKLFDYMATGLPVLATTVVPIARIVEATGCGVVVPEDDSDALAEALVELADPAVRSDMARGGLEAVTGRYHWERDAARLQDVVGAVARGRC